MLLGAWPNGLSAHSALTSFLSLAGIWGKRETRTWREECGPSVFCDKRVCSNCPTIAMVLTLTSWFTRRSRSTVLRLPTRFAGLIKPFRRKQEAFWTGMPAVVRSQSDRHRISVSGGQAGLCRCGFMTTASAGEGTLRIRADRKASRDNRRRRLGRRSGGLPGYPVRCRKRRGGRLGLG